MRDKHQSVVLHMGHIDARGGAVGWIFLLDHLTPEGRAVVQEQTDPVKIARYAGWGLKSLRAVGLHVRRN